MEAFRLRVKTKINMEIAHRFMTKCSPSDRIAYPHDPAKEGKAIAFDFEQRSVWLTGQVLRAPYVLLMQIQ